MTARRSGSAAPPGRLRSTGRLSSTGRVVLAWLAGALLLAGLPGPAAALAGASASPAGIAGVASSGASPDPTAVLVDRQPVGHRAGRSEIAGADAGRAEFARQIRPSHGGFGGLADLVPGPDQVGPAATTAVLTPRHDVPGSPAPASLRGRAPPAQGAPRPAGPTSV